MAFNNVTSSWMLGINLSGAEYGDPYIGRMYWDYIYPTTQELDHYASEGARVVRLPISLERLQPISGGALDAIQLSFLDALVARAGADGLRVILDPHNYGYAYGTEIGSTAASNAAFADFWSKLAAHYAANSNVVFGLMNEPNTQSPTQWLVSANMAIAAIRQVGATSQEILIPGTSWDTGATWLQSGNGAVLANGVVDPSHNYAFEIHQYFDVDNSGSHNAVVSATIGVERLQAVTEWAASTGNRLFLGEFGVASDPLSLQALSNTLAYMQTHSDVWQGGTYWAAGPWMSSYVYTTETANGSDTPQMTTLEQFMAPPKPNAVKLQPAIKIITGNRDGGITLAGSSAANSTVTLSDTIGSATTVLGTAVSASNGVWSFTSHEVVKAAVINNYTILAQDQLGNRGSMAGQFLLASMGADTLIGTTGVADVFAIMSFKGSNVIKGFETSLSAGSAHDIINLSGRGITSFNQIQSMLSGSSSAVINIGLGKTISLTDVPVNSLTASDFRYS